MPNRALLSAPVKRLSAALKSRKRLYFCIDARAPAKQFCFRMTNPGKSGGEVFRPSATRLFLFYVVLGLPILACIFLLRDCFHARWLDLMFGGSPTDQPDNFRSRWGDLLLGAAFLVPLGVIFAGIVSLLLPVRLTAEGVHAHSVWGLPRFIRWREIQSIREFRLPILPWLRLYPADGSTAVWLIMFQSFPAKFKLEIQKLAPPGNPILSHLD
jgi:hypothetical protein